MKTFTEPAEVKKLLEDWRGADAKVWLFHVTHKRLAVRFTHPDRLNVLYVVGNGCERMSGPFSWKRVSVHYQSNTEHETGSETCRISDAAAGFELVCSSIVLVEAPVEHFPQSFDGFFGSSEASAG